MTFFNKKTEVMQIEMTPYGRYLYSIGKFKPHSYEFVDDDILYKASGSTEAHEDIHQRILNETPKLKINRAFQKEDSQFFFMRVFVKFTNPLIKIFKPITPTFIIQPIVPLYVAWFFFMIRFYLMPWILGYSVMGMLSFPLESEISRQIYQFFNSIKF